MKKFAVLILNYNGKHFLANCYKSLYNQNTKDFDIYLVDNNSTDGSREYTKKNFPKVKIFNTGKNAGFTGAYNMVCKYFYKKKIFYKYYLLLNNDTENDKSLIKTLYTIFDSNPNIGIVMPTIVHPNMRIALKAGTFLFLSGTTWGESGSKYKRGSNIYKCFWASGCALAIRASLFKNLGYFPDYFIYYEDVDISWNVNNYGYDVVSTDMTYVKHIQGGSNTSKPFQHYLCERNRVLCYWRNLPSSVFFAFLPLFFLVRLGLLFYTTHTFFEGRAKIKGFYDGISSLHKYKKKTYSLKKHIEILKEMNNVRVLTNANLLVK